MLRKLLGAAASGFSKYIYIYRERERECICLGLKEVPISPLGGLCTSHSSTWELPKIRGPNTDHK